jgi:hypothetical protein
MAILLTIKWPVWPQANAGAGSNAAPARRTLTNVVQCELEIFMTCFLHPDNITVRRRNHLPCGTVREVRQQPTPRSSASMSVDLHIFPTA